VFVGDDFPELGTDLVAALASLNVNELAHLEVLVEGKKRKSSIQSKKGTK
jgi:hypothetical protein